MLNPFPGLFDYSFGAPTLLRIAAALVFAYIAYRQWEHREPLSRISFPVIGAGTWIVWTTIVFEIITALGLFFGFLTQIAAILGMLMALKYFFWHHRYPDMMPLSRTGSLLLFVVCLSLLLTGGGAHAFDLRL